MTASHHSRHGARAMSSSLLCSPYLLLGVALGASLSTLILLPLLPAITTSLRNSGYHRLRREVPAGLRDVNDALDATLPDSDARTTRQRKVEFTGDFNAHDVFSSERHRAPNTVKPGYLYTAILSDGNSQGEFPSAIEMTWGSQVQDLQFYETVSTQTRAKRTRMPTSIVLEDVGDVTHGAEHVQQTLAYVCEHVMGHHLWYLVVKETTYVNWAALLSVLDRLSPTQPIILGHSLEPDNPQHCSVTSGLVFSQGALSTVCPNIRRCDVRAGRLSTSQNQQQSLSIQRNSQLTRCIHEMSGVGCLNAELFSKDFYSAYREQSFPGDSSLAQTAFVEDASTVKDLLRIHLTFTETRIANTENEILRLGRELSGAVTLGSAINRPKRDGGDTKGNIYFVQDMLVNSTDDPGQANLIDQSGRLYLDDCRITQTGTEENEAYDSAQKLAKEAIGHDVSGMEAFAVKTDRPNLGTEFQMFYVEDGIKKKTKQRPDKIYHVTVAQPYGEFHFQSKEAVSMQTINIVLNDGNIVQLIDFLENVSKECRKFEELGGHCKIYLPTRGKLDFLLQQFGTSHFSIALDTLDLPTEKTSSKFVLDKVKSVLDDESLILWTSSDVVLELDFLLRCQLNTKIRHKLYLPVAFQQYEAKAGLSTITNQSGYWRSSASDAICAYVHDLNKLDGESVSDMADAYRQFKQMPYEIKRTPDPSVQKLWNDSWCSEDSVQFRDRCKEELKFINIQ